MLDLKAVNLLTAFLLITFTLFLIRLIKNKRIFVKKNLKT